MSKKILSFTLVGLIAAVVGSYYVFSPTKDGASSMLGIEDSTIMLYVEEGDVSYKTSTMETFQRATSSSVAISNNSYVHTGLGQATILFPDNSSVSLDHYTELFITHEAKKLSLLQTLGTTYHRVEALVAGATYEVETPGTLAAVRGTKFAVNYDKKSKTTKVAVTEHAVLVSKLKSETVSTTKEVIESIVLEEGKTARLKVETQSAGTRNIDIVETDADTEMKSWVEKNKEKDAETDSIRQDATLSKKEVRAELESSFQKKQDNTPAPATPSNSTKSDDPRQPEAKTSDTATTGEQQTSEGGTQVGTAPAQTAVKIEEEAFFNVFNDLYTRYFYLDDNDSPCTLRITAAERVRIVAAYAAQSGYTFKTDTLAEFAGALDIYCGKKDPITKTTLKARFDSDYPFQEDL